MRVASFPSIEQLSENPYWRILRSGLAEQGVETVSPTEFSRGWLQRARGWVDVLHFHYVQPYYAYELKQARLRWVLRFARNVLLARALGYRTVFTLHNLTPTYPLRPRRVDALGHWVAARLMDAVIVHCDYARSALAKRFGRNEEVYVIDHPHFVGVYPDEITRTVARAALNLGDDQIAFLFFGGLRPNKGIATLIRSFGSLPDANLRLVVAGKPWPPDAHVEELHKLAARDERVQLFAQFIPDHEVQVFLEAADAVVLPFRSILTSSSTILAMSFGRPVVVPEMGCLPQLLAQDTGLLYDPANTGGLRRALRRAVAVDLRGMGEAARRRVEAFTPEAFARDTLVVYGMEPR